MVDEQGVCKANCRHSALLLSDAVDKEGEPLEAEHEPSQTEHEPLETERDHSETECEPADSHPEAEAEEAGGQADAADSSEGGFSICVYRARSALARGGGTWLHS